MTLQDIKQISIRTYLSRRGIQSTRENPRCGFYLSPLRSEHTPNFKVDYAQNLWYDHGTGEGGSIIDLVMRLENCDFTQAVQSLGRDEIKPISSVAPALATPTVPALRILSDSLLRHPALLGYLKERGVDPAIANEYCREVRYAVGDKTYFAIGFLNMAGGYEVRNRYFKGCVAPKDITHIRQQGGQRCMCYLFEGFMDYLSFLTIRVENNPQHPRLDTQDYIILNSVSNLAKAESILETYTQVGCFLDNDTAGRNTCKKLKEKFGERLLDKSMYYREYKDLNDYLCGKPLSQSAEPIKEKKQVQSARRMMQPPKKKGGFHL